MRGKGDVKQGGVLGARAGVGDPRDDGAAGRAVVTKAFTSIQHKPCQHSARLVPFGSPARGERREPSGQAAAGHDLEALGALGRVIPHPMLREECAQRLLARRQINPHLHMTSRGVRSTHVILAGLRLFLWRRTDRMES